MLRSLDGQPVFRSVELRKMEPRWQLTATSVEGMSSHEHASKRLATSPPVASTGGSPLQKPQVDQQSAQVKREIEELRQLQRRLLEELYEKRHLLMMGMKSAANSTDKVSTPRRSKEGSLRQSMELAKPMHNTISFRKLQREPQSASVVIPIFRASSTANRQRLQQSAHISATDTPKRTSPHSPLPQIDRFVEHQRQQLPTRDFERVPLANYQHPRVSVPERLDTTQQGYVTLRNTNLSQRLQSLANHHEFQPEHEQTKRHHYDQDLQQPRLQTRSDNIYLHQNPRNSLTSVEMEVLDELDSDTYLRLQENKIGRQRLELSRLSKKIDRSANQQQTFRPRMSLHERDRMRVEQDMSMRQQSRSRGAQYRGNEKRLSNEMHSRAPKAKQEKKPPLRQRRQTSSDSRRNTSTDKASRILSNNHDGFHLERHELSILEKPAVQRTEQTYPRLSHRASSNSKQSMFRRRSQQQPSDRNVNESVLIIPSQQSSAAQEQVHVDKQEIVRFMHLLCQSIVLESYAEKLRVRLGGMLDEALELLGLDGKHSSTTHKKLAGKLVSIIRGGRSFGRTETEEFVNKLFPKGNKVSYEAVAKLLRPLPNSPRHSPHKRHSLSSDQEQANELLHRLFSSLTELSYFQDCLVEHALSDPQSVAHMFDSVHSGKSMTQFDLVNYIRSNTSTSVTVQDVELYLDRRIQKHHSGAYQKSELLKLFTGL